MGEKLNELSLVPFTCKDGHTYPRRKANLDKPGCAVCSGRLLFSGVNDLGTTHPELALEWSSENKQGPETYHAGAKVKVKWVCSKNHIWECRIATRSKHGITCHFCNGHYLLSGFNDLATLHPQVASEWAPDNVESPSNFLPQSQKKVWWVCRDCSHEWRTTPQKRVLGSACPNCSRNQRSSKGEREVGDWLLGNGVDIIRNDVTILDPYEIDIWIPSLKLGIEYQGDYWHGADYMHSGGESASQRAAWKLHRAKKVGINLFYVWESDWKNNHAQILQSLKKLITTRTADPILMKPTKKK